MSTNWEQLAAEHVADLTTWRQEHPKATMLEIEDAMQTRLRALYAAGVTALVHESAAQHWQAGDTQVPACPECGTALHARGAQERRLTTVGDHAITLQRTYGVCPVCQTGLFPPGPRTDAAAGEPGSPPAPVER
ncbi:hypothetical protein [Metallibacterium sp.]